MCKCVQPHAMRSIACGALERTQPLQNSHGIVKQVMARATRVSRCTWRALDCVLLGSIADALNRVMLRLDHKCAQSQLLCDRTY
jgi:hypothetical protein